MIIFIIGLTSVFSALLWWLLITTEGVYLGRRVVIWLYDIYAQRYDSIKHASEAYEQAFTAKPIMNHIPLADPLTLDVATGTGRLPYTLLQHDEFAGQIIGIDLSRAMLVVAAQKLGYAIEQGQVLLMDGPAEQLPFLDNSFDLVTCFEALEFMVDDHIVMTELVRVLRPDGTLVVTNRQGRDRVMMPGKVRTHDAFEQWLTTAFGLSIERYDTTWSDIYALVIARKAGQSEPIGTTDPLWAVLRCPNCNASQLAQDTSTQIVTWMCTQCGHKMQQAFDGIINVRTQ